MNHSLSKQPLISAPECERNHSTVLIVHAAYCGWVQLHVGDGGKQSEYAQNAVVLRCDGLQLGVHAALPTDGLVILLAHVYAHNRPKNRARKSGRAADRIYRIHTQATAILYVSLELTLKLNFLLSLYVCTSTV